MADMLSKEQIKQLRIDIEAALAQVAQKHKMQAFKLGTIRYDADGFRAPLEAQFEGGESADMKALRLNAAFMGFKPEIAGSTIDYANKKCKVVGMKRTKLLLEVDGKECTAPIDSVLRVLKAQKSSLVHEASPAF